MDTAQRTPAARHKAACDRERDAWLRLEQRRAVRTSCQAQDVDGWLEATRAFRDSQAEVTAVTVHRAMQALRDSAALLSGPGPALEPEAIKGRRYLDGDGIPWEVLAVVVDLFEPEFFLVQIAHADAGDADPVDVFSDDWRVFCLVHRLRPA